jgi:transcriptional regulator with XRE-family HTH domain
VLQLNFSNIVKKKMIDLNISKAEVARLSGYSQTHIGDLLEGTRRWNEKTIEKVSGVLGIKIKFSA